MISTALVRLSPCRPDWLERVKSGLVAPTEHATPKGGFAVANIKFLELLGKAGLLQGFIGRVF